MICREPVSLSVAGTAGRGLAGEPIAIQYDGPTDGLSWSLVDSAGAVAADGLQPFNEADALVLRPAADLPEGELQVQVQLSTGLVARAPLLIDRTPPRIEVARLADGLALTDVQTIGALDRFRLDVTDATRVSLESDGDLNQGELGASDGVVRVAAIDAAGNRTESDYRPDARRDGARSDAAAGRGK